MKSICRDLEAQYLELDTIVSRLNEERWFDETPFYGWTIFDQVAHIAFFDQQALLAIEDPKTFGKGAKRILQRLASEGEWPEKTNPLLGAKRPDALINLWRQVRSRLLNRLKELSTKDRIAWYGPDMSALSFATARLMETWAHAQDVFDTLQVQRVNTASLRHVAHIGVSTFRWSFKIKKRPIPNITPRVELVGPSGERWAWGDRNYEEFVTGSAEEFCLVVTQRRNIAETSLSYEGDHVKQWLQIAQAFAGISQNPPAPGERFIS
jgi:uncharacterized protein (TIGR03084 family)